MRANVFGSVTDSNEMLWPHAGAAGFEVRVVERSVSGKEKRVDTGVVTRICRDAYLLGQPGRDRITLVADGFEVTLLYWSTPVASCRRSPAASMHSTLTLRIWPALRTCYPPPLTRNLSPDCGDRAVDHRVDRLCRAGEGGKRATPR
ncbi:hypothetical protein ACFQU7_40240 [Pseudoroseomonas wenyumeiae]